MCLPGRAAPRRGPIYGALARTSVLRSKTLAEGEFTSPEQNEKRGPRADGTSGGAELHPRTVGNADF